MLTSAEKARKAYFKIKKTIGLNNTCKLPVLEKNSLIPLYYQFHYYFCQFCLSLVEDEMHFLLRCAKYQNIRTSYNSLFQREEGTIDADLHRVILNPESLSS